MRAHELLLRFEIALDRQISRSLLRLQKLQEKQENRKNESRDLKFDPQEPEKVIPKERTQQPPETKQPAIAASATPAKPTPQIVSTDRRRLPQNTNSRSESPAHQVTATDLSLKRSRS